MLAVTQRTCFILVNLHRVRTGFSVIKAQTPPPPFAQLFSLGQICRKENVVSSGQTQTGNLFQPLLLVPAHRGSSLLLFSSEDKDMTYTAGKLQCCKSCSLFWQYGMFAAPQAADGWIGINSSCHADTFFGDTFIYKLEQAVTTGVWPSNNPALMSGLKIK